VLALKELSVKGRALQQTLPLGITIFSSGKMGKNWKKWEKMGKNEAICA
jgi:phosphoribosyl-AMP cyclohydrolase